MKRLEWSALNPVERRRALARPAQRRDARVVDAVRAILEDVERDGEAAVARWAVKLDGVMLADTSTKLWPPSVEWHIAPPEL